MMMVQLHMTQQLRASDDLKGAKNNRVGISMGSKQLLSHGLSTGDSKQICQLSLPASCNLVSKHHRWRSSPSCRSSKSSMQDWMKADLSAMNMVKMVNNQRHMVMTEFNHVSRWGNSYEFMRFVSPQASVFEF